MEFDTPAVLKWLAELQALPRREAVSQLLIELERLSTAEPAVRTHLEVMRLLKRPVLKLAASLPRPDPRRPDGGLPPAGAMTAEQRLDHWMQVNFNRLVINLDRNRYRSPVASEENRQWAMRQQMKFIRRQVRYALLARRPCLPGTWQDAHDMFAYLVIRGNVELHGATQVDPLKHEFDPYFDYRRLLLLGRAAQLDLPADVLATLMQQLDTWARESVLLDPDGCRGNSNQLLVELSHDRAVRAEVATLLDGFRGWVLQPAPGFVQLCRIFDRKADALQVSDRTL